MTPRPLKILAVDDHMDNLVTLRAEIGDLFPGAQTITELSGERALLLASIEDPDVILLDILMPGMDGFEVCRNLKNDPMTQDIPVVFLTALKGDRESRIVALECGAEAFLTKPIDETELKAVIQAMAKIKESNVLRKTDLMVSDLALRSISQGVIITGPDRKVLSVNPAFEAMTGYSRGEVLGRDCRFLQGTQTEADQTLAIRRALGGHQPFHGELVNYRKDGTLFWNELTISPVRDNQGGITHFIGITRDISQRKADEAHQKELLAQLYQSQKMESLGILASGVAHDMNNVLAAISAIASLNLQTSEAGTRHHKAFQTILNAVNRGGGMVSALLSFTRKDLAQIKALDWNALILGQVALLEHSTLSKVTLRTDLDPRLPLIRGDAGALENVLMNLAVNAVDAMTENEGERLLTLRTRPDGDQVRVEVSDNGSGMTSEVQSRAFDPFFTTKPQGKGTGLGLSLVFSTVQSHGGRLEVESDPGQGTTIRMTFPALPLVEGIPKAREEVAPVPRIDKAVLLVDDDEFIRESFGDLLEALGCRFTAVPLGELALEKLAAGQHFDVVILDMNMPGMGGVQTLAAIRRQKPQVPVLVTTGLANQQVLDLLATTPRTTLLSKPFDLRSLRAALKNAEGLQV